MPDGARDRLRRDREAAAAACEARFEALTDSYPLGHAARRRAFVRDESEKLAREVEQAQLQATPEADRRGRR